MKKYFFLALAMAVCLSSSAAKKDKKTTTATKAAAVSLVSGSDSLSYAAGFANTQGLIPYLLQMKMDTTYMADFIAGMQEAMAKSSDPSFTARSMGYNIYSQLNDRMLTGLAEELKQSPDSLNKDMFFAGFFDALHNDTTKFNVNGASEFFQNRMKADQEAKKEALYGENRKKGEAFLADNKTKEGVITTPSGLQYKIITKGTGVIPTATQEVSVKYEGKLIDGTEFDSSYKRKDPVTKFRANQVIKGWTEALTMMPVGSVWELYIPQELAYGDREAGKIPPFSTLIFKVELVDVDGQLAKAAEEAKKAEEADAAKAAEKTATKKTTKKSRK